MPYGCCRPCANTDTVAVVPLADGRSTFTRLLCVSVRKTSPLGATFIARGPLSPVRYTSILKPGGNLSFAFAGFGTTLGKFDADGVAPGAGNFATTTRCTTPGASFFQSAFACDNGLGAGAPAPGRGAAPGTGWRRAIVHGREVGNEIVAISRLRHRDDHRGTGYHGGRRGEKARQRGAIPGETGLLQCIAVTEIAGGGLATHDACEVRPCAPPLSPASALWHSAHWARKKVRPAAESAPSTGTLAIPHSVAMASSPRTSMLFPDFENEGRPERMPLALYRGEYKPKIFAASREKLPAAASA